MEAQSEKDAIRRVVWSLMEDKGIAKFPKPVFGRIPNFAGAEQAASMLFEQMEYREAKVIKVNPDAPQRRVRLRVLLDGKTLLMPSPRLRCGFLILNPSRIRRELCGEASAIGGAFRYGRPCSLRELPQVDLIVAGSVAVSVDGVRVGKGGGYSELEYAVLREIGAAAEETPIFTTVHDVQVVGRVPQEPHDLTVDAIITPTRVVRVERSLRRPEGIFWEKIAPKQLREIPILRELKAVSSGS